MPRALNLIRAMPHYRRDAFDAGLKACGFHVFADEAQLRAPGPDDALVTWNRYGTFDAVARRFASAGATVIVAENGYLGADRAGHQLYAIARNWHAGAGTWQVGEADRWGQLGMAMRPWREDGEYVVIFGQRGFGEREVAPPSPDWWSAIIAAFKSAGHSVHFRPHPEIRGLKPVPPPLEQDLAGAHAVVTWSSSAALKAILHGVPAYHAAPWWIGAPAATAIDYRAPVIAPCFRGDRLPMLRRLAWAQWTVEEIGTGEPFRHLLHHAG